MIHLYLVLRWSFGVVLWEITTLGEQMCMRLQHIIMYACLAHVTASSHFLLLLPSLLRWPPLPLHWEQSPPHSPVERIPHGQARELLNWHVRYIDWKNIYINMYTHIYRSHAHLIYCYVDTLCVDTYLHMQRPILLQRLSSFEIIFSFICIYIHILPYNMYLLCVLASFQYGLL